jgi:multidrug transporter EmrE-like cation transporter
MGLQGGGLPTFNTIPFGFAASMASIDSFMLSFVKYISLHKQYVGLLFIPMVFYTLQPLIFYFSLQYETLTVMNLLWDVISDVVITLIGLLFFQEKIGPYKRAGVILSFISIVLMSLNDGDTLFSS